MIGSSTFSIEAFPNTLGSTEANTGYRVIGDVGRSVSHLIKSVLTDTICISELEIPVVESVSKECLEFCDSQGLTSILADCLSKAKELFSSRIKLSADLDYFRDDQEENTPHVVIRVEVKSDQQTAIGEYDQFACWMATEIPSSDGYLFTITVKRV
ncbi:MAG: hypothetical protein A2168_07485 [Planctomycetes bacterium RBG_13_50_24]|nr:MAG: hypothetical protein A2168_07485 [Planctomycetes bacterium RBG_13_50_24]